MLGYGEKQDDDLLHNYNYTVAKAVMDCTVELKKKKMTIYYIIIQ